MAFKVVSHESETQGAVIVGYVIETPDPQDIANAEAALAALIASTSTSPPVEVAPDLPPSGV